MGGDRNIELGDFWPVRDLFLLENIDLYFAHTAGYQGRESVKKSCQLYEIHSRWQIYRMWLVSTVLGDD